ncbi:hypothetical protein NPX13_g6744 [Xylaria arbuscula]|uniref:NAD(P)-binding protein n=1 Tax=Xylaria arbuscula TaxID=114810 RepID=A0A9W8NBA3_9PEZI|nr:hypothetical protein NPX13_g6744 [Xylaria arbuscula]
MSKQYSLPEGSVWFVTGCSSGIGRAFATYLSGETSYRLVATARNISSLDYIPDSPKVLKLSLDISSASQVQEAVLRAITLFGRIDIVINNAGVSVYGDTETTTDDQARKMFETNLWGAMNLTREAVRVMREENPKTGQIGGVVVYMSGFSARIGLAGGSYYMATRFGMDGFYESFSNELLPEWNIHFSVAQPGLVNTNYFQQNVILTERHPAYVDPRAATNKIVAVVKGEESSDYFAAEPEKLVEVIIDMVTNGVGDLGIPLRLPLGEDSWAAIEHSLKTSLEEHNALKAVALRATTHD